MNDKLRKYIREYVMTLYKAKMEDGDEDYQYKFTSDIEHPDTTIQIIKLKQLT